MLEQNTKKLAAPKRQLLNGKDIQEWQSYFDADIKKYKDTRTKFKDHKIKTDLDVIEVFNHTALTFIPILQKRIQ